MSFMLSPRRQIMRSIYAIVGGSDGAPAPPGPGTPALEHVNGHSRIDVSDSAVGREDGSSEEELDDSRSDYLLAEPADVASDINSDSGSADEAREDESPTAGAADLDSSLARSSPALSNQALSNQALSNQALSNQALSNQALSNQALSNQALPNQVLSSQALSSQGRNSQILSSQERNQTGPSRRANPPFASGADSGPTESTLAGSSQSDTSTPVSNQAASHQLESAPLDPTLLEPSPAQPSQDSTQIDSSQAVSSQSDSSQAAAGQIAAGPAEWPKLDVRGVQLVAFEFDFQELEPVAAHAEESYVLSMNRDDSAVSVWIDQSGVLLPEDSLEVTVFVLEGRPVILFKSIEDILMMIRGVALNASSLARLRLASRGSPLVATVNLQHPITQSALKKKLVNRKHISKCDLQVVELSNAAPLLTAILAAENVSLFFT